MCVVLRIAQRHTSAISYITIGTEPFANRREEKKNEANTSIDLLSPTPREQGILVVCSRASATRRVVLTRRTTASGVPAPTPVAVAGAAVVAVIVAAAAEEGGEEPAGKTRAPTPAGRAVCGIRAGASAGRIGGAGSVVAE